MQYQMFEDGFLHMLWEGIFGLPELLLQPEHQCLCFLGVARVLVVSLKL